MKKACLKYDFEHNAYNIKQESEEFQECVAKYIDEGTTPREKHRSDAYLSMLGIAPADEKFTQEVMNKTTNYINQLEEDNNYPWDKLQAVRIDGFNFLITLPDSKLKVQQTLYYDAQKEEVKAMYKVLEK